jgi:phosphopantothenoylcysteine decarboxylase/phosphopantothenate--cysteine ligase
MALLKNQRLMNQDFLDKKILLGITGGVAAYKSAHLVRELRHLGADVRVVMTRSAAEFITPLSFQALSAHPVHIDLLNTDAEHAMGHIELARWADYYLIAPATANFLAKIAHGLADDLVSTLALVVDVPVLVCPGMNQSMWHHAATQANCEILKQRGVVFVGPDEGAQACGEYGFGRMSDVHEIISALRLIDVGPILVGQSVIITAGPTREAIDPVRYISNHSSGKMGYALARAAARAGAQVTLISGPTALAVPAGVTCIFVDCAQKMYDVVMQSLEQHPSSIFIGAAAVADYYVDKPADIKLKKKNNSSLSLTLLPNRDILATVAASQRASFVVGFAAETRDVLVHAREKLNKKKSDMIIANAVGNGLGFEEEENAVTVLTQALEQFIPRAHKMRVAGNLIAVFSFCRKIISGCQKSLGTTVRTFVF